MFPYYLLPKADDRQAPDKERKPSYDPLSSIRTRKPKPKRQNPVVPLVVFTAFGVDRAEQLRKRLENTQRPVDKRPQSKSKPYDPLSSIQAPSAKPISKDKQTQTSSEPSVPDLQQNIEGESDTRAPDLEKAWSSEVPYLYMGAADLSYYNSAQQDDLVHGVAISLRHEKLILSYLDDPIEYLKRFATYTWDEESDKAAEEFIQWYVDRFRSELERQRDIDWSEGVESDIEYWIRDVANDERESVIVYDLDADEILFIRFGDKDSVTMQKLHQKLAEGRNIVVIHNHPNNTGASLADLDAAAWLDAELMFIVNPDGALHRYTQIGDEMVALEPLHNPDYVAAADPVETVAADLAYLLQSLREIGNPPEMVMEQGETAPKLSDYIYDPQSRRTDRPLFDQGFAQYDPPDLLSSPSNILALQALASVAGEPNLAVGYYAGAGPGHKITSELVRLAATWGEVVGWDMAGKLLKHHLEMSGEPYEIPVDGILADVPGLRKSIVEHVGFGLGELFAPNNAEGGGSEDKVLEEVGDHTVYAFPLDWREVGIGTEDDIYGFNGDMSASPEAIVNLLQGIPLDENAKQETYDWYLALGKFYYYPRVTVVVDNNTGNAEVGLVIEVRDQYDWHADAGPLDSIMAGLEEAGFGRNFPMTGRSAPITGSFNLNDVTIRSEKEYYQLKIEGWDDDE